LAGSRTANLILRAATRGVIDFSQMKFFDSHWHRRVRLLLKGLSDEDNRELYMALHRHSIAKFGLEKLLLIKCVLSVELHFEKGLFFSALQSRGANSSSLALA